MDSLSVLLEMHTQQETFWLKLLLDFFAAIAPSIVGLGGIFVAIYSMRLTRSLKEKDIEESRKERKFRLELEVSKKVIEVMSESYHRVHEINRILSRHPSNEAQSKELWNSVLEARVYWEKNVFYLPLQVRKIMVPMTNKVFATLSGHDTLHLAYVDIMDAFRNLESAFSELMQEYNMFDNLASNIEAHSKED